MENFLRCVRASANLRALMTQKSCAVGMRNAILGNPGKSINDIKYNNYTLLAQSSWLWLELAKNSALIG